MCNSVCVPHCPYYSITSV